MLLRIPTDRCCRWSRLLALFLAVAVLGQSLPVSAALHWAHRTSQVHTIECNHQGVCPKNPDGPCPCDHSHTKDAHDTDDPVLTNCSGDQPDTPGITPVPKWRSSVNVAVPIRPHFRSEWTSRYLTYSSQWTSDEIFHPPRRQTG